MGRRNAFGTEDYAISVSLCATKQTEEKVSVCVCAIACCGAIACCERP